MIIIAVDLSKLKHNNPAFQALLCALSFVDVSPWLGRCHQAVLQKTNKLQRMSFIHFCFKPVCSRKVNLRSMTLLPLIISLRVRMHSPRWKGCLIIYLIWSHNDNGVGEPFEGQEEDSGNESNPQGDAENNPPVWGWQSQDGFNPSPPELRNQESKIKQLSLSSRQRESTLRQRTAADSTLSLSTNMTQGFAVMDSGLLHSSSSSLYHPSSSNTTEGFLALDSLLLGPMGGLINKLPFCIENAWMNKMQGKFAHWPILHPTRPIALQRLLWMGLQHFLWGKLWLAGRHWSARDLASLEQSDGETDSDSQSEFIVVWLCLVDPSRYNTKRKVSIIFVGAYCAKVFAVSMIPFLGGVWDSMSKTTTTKIPTTQADTMLAMKPKERERHLSLTWYILHHHWRELKVLNIGRDTVGMGNVFLEITQSFL